MLLHIRPRLFSSFRNVAIVDLRIEKLGLHLAGGTDLASRRPYPNRHYSVACRKQGQKALDGILIETPGVIDEFHCCARWAVDAERIVEHTVHYQLLDHEFDAASDHMILWHRHTDEFGDWPDRRPAWWTKDTVPVYAEPVMHATPAAEAAHKRKETIDEEDCGWVVRRWQNFAMPTIERDRLLTSSVCDRTPPLASAFRPGRIVVMHPHRPRTRGPQV